MIPELLKYNKLKEGIAIATKIKAGMVVHTISKRVL